MNQIKKKEATNLFKDKMYNNKSNLQENKNNRNIYFRHGEIKISNLWLQMKK